MTQTSNWTTCSIIPLTGTNTVLFWFTITFYEFKWSFFFLKKKKKKKKKKKDKKKKEKKRYYLWHIPQTIHNLVLGIHQNCTGDIHLSFHDNVFVFHNLAEITIHFEHILLGKKRKVNEKKFSHLIHTRWEMIFENKSPLLLHQNHKKREFLWHN